MLQALVKVIHNIIPDRSHIKGKTQPKIDIPVYAENWSRCESGAAHGVLVLAVPNSKPPVAPLLGVELQAVRYREVPSLCFCFIPRTPFFGDQIEKSLKNHALQTSGLMGAPLGKRAEFLNHHSPRGHFPTGPCINVNGDSKSIERFLSRLSGAKELIPDQQVRDAVIELLTRCIIVPDLSTERMPPIPRLE